jgi:hypothetical protein
LAQRDAATVRRIFRQQVVLDQNYVIELVTRQFVCQCRDAFSDYYARDRAFGLLRNLLRRRAAR